MASQHQTNPQNTRAHPHHSQTQSPTKRHPHRGEGGAARQRTLNPTSPQLPLPVGGRGAGGPHSRGPSCNHYQHTTPNLDTAFTHPRTPARRARGRHPHLE